MNPTYYQVLGVARTATQAEIKAAFKALAIRFHPDKHGGSTVYETRFKQVNEAYQVLSDARKKQLYDLKLNYSAPRPTNFGATSPYQASTIFRQPGSANFNPGPGYRPNYQPPPPPRPAQAQAPRRDPRKLTPREYGIVVFILACLVGFGVVLKFTMDHITAVDNYETAVSLMQEQRYTQAHRLLQEAVHFKPTYGEAYLKMADIELLAFNMPAAAQRNYTRAFTHLAHVPPESYYARAKSYLLTGNFEAAEKDLVQTVKADSAFVRAWLDLGMLRLHNTGQAEESVADFSRFLEQSTDTALRAQAYQFRGYAQHLTGSFGAGEKDFREALRLDPNNTVTYSLLAELKLSQRDTAAACSYFAIAYNLGDQTQESNLRRYCGKTESAF